MENQTIYNLCIKGKNGSLGIAQLWLLGELQYALLIMMNNNYWEIKILISTKIRDKLKIGLKTHGILKDTWSPISLDIEIFISVKKAFVTSVVWIMLDNKCKINVDFLFYNRIYSFIYDTKTIEPRQFPDPKIFHVDNF